MGSLLPSCHLQRRPIRSFLGPFCTSSEWKIGISSWITLAKVAQHSCSLSPRDIKTGNMRSSQESLILYCNTGRVQVIKEPPRGVSASLGWDFILLKLIKENQEKSSLHPPLCHEIQCNLLQIRQPNFGRRTRLLEIKVCSLCSSTCDISLP